MNAITQSSSRNFSHDREADMPWESTDGDEKITTFLTSSIRSCNILEKIKVIIIINLQTGSNCYHSNIGPGVQTVRINLQKCFQCVSDAHFLFAIKFSFMLHLK